MARLLRLLLGATLAIGLFATCAGAATAAVFYVNQRGASATCTSKGSGACQKISEAVVQAEKASGANTIEVESEAGSNGFYDETVDLASPKDAGLTINGAEAGVVIAGPKDPAVIAHFAGTLTLSNVSLRGGLPSATLKSTVALRGTTLTLSNDEIENEGIDGVEAKEGGSVTVEGGSVVMEDGATGYAVYDEGGPLTLNGAKLIDGSESEAEAGGVYSAKSTLAMTNTNVYEETGFGTQTYGIVTEEDTSASLQSVLVRQSTPAIGVINGATALTANALHVEMLRSSSNAAAILDEDEAGTASTSLSHLEVGGSWIGPGVLAGGAAVTLSDSRVIESATSAKPALQYVEGVASQGLLVQRSVLQAAAAAKPAALQVFNANATTDSSEILGGKAGVDLESGAETTATLTLSSSTIDAGAPGIAADAAGVLGVEATAKTGARSIADVSIQGSIVLERQAASTTGGAQASIDCAYSAAPSQTQAAGGGGGAIACATGSSGNTEVSPLSSLFPEPLSGYQLSASSSAVDSVPVAAITLPFGLTPSTTDLEGNPRLESVACNMVQDKGALELAGHGTPCPTATATTTTTTTTTSGAGVASAKPLKPVLSGLSISPSAFLAAPSGATLTAATAKKKKYGANISYRDSALATTTFTVLRPTSGRMQGKSCRKPSKKNQHAKRCTLYVALGSFTHSDHAGAISLRFSGRLKGKRLAPGGYRLQAVASDAAGRSAAVAKGFTIK